MENILLVLNIIFAIILVLLVLMQKSEGGALRYWCFSRKFYVFKICRKFYDKSYSCCCNTLFIICSLGLTIVSRGDLAPTSSVLDTVEEKTEDTPSIPENNN